MFNPFLANNLILYLLKTPENVWFLVFSGGKKWELWLLTVFGISLKANSSLTNFPILYPLKTQGKQKFSGGKK